MGSLSGSTGWNGEQGARTEAFFLHDGDDGANAAVRGFYLFP